MNDGIRGMLPREKMCEGAKRYWDFYSMRGDAGFYQREFGFYSLEKWQAQEGLDKNADVYVEARIFRAKPLELFRGNNILKQ